LNLIDDKKKSINALHAYQIIQTELEADFGLLKLEFRFDTDLELDLDLFEAELQNYVQYLSEIDAIIQKTLFEIEVTSEKINNFSFCIKLSGEANRYINLLIINGLQLNDITFP
jgi:hypothetical protein